MMSGLARGESPGSKVLEPSWCLALPSGPAFVGRATPALTPVAGPQPSQAVLTDHRALQRSTRHGPGSPSLCRRGGGQVGTASPTVAGGHRGIRSHGERLGETGCPPWSEEGGTEDVTGYRGAGCSRPRAGVQEGRGGTPRPGVAPPGRQGHGGCGRQMQAVGVSSPLGPKRRAALESANREQGSTWDGDSRHGTRPPAPRPLECTPTDPALPSTPGLSPGGRAAPSTGLGRE